MCGIIGYTGTKRDVVKVLINGLKRLEYRGYDSCGSAVLNCEGKIELDRVKGRVDLLVQRVLEKNYKNVSCGIAHTRWATHGIPAEENAHPHTDCRNEIVVVHNGIIENYLELKTELNKHDFKSETDTEVIPHLIEELINQNLRKEVIIKSEFLQPVFFKAFIDVVSKLKGSFALAVMWSKVPGVILAARRFSPLVIGVGEEEFFVSSDVAGFLEYTKKTYFVDDDEIVFLDPKNIAFFDINGKKKNKEISLISWDIKMAEKGGYRHFMIKEIFEQDIGFENTIMRRVLPVDSNLFERETGISDNDLKSFSHIHFVGCGTAYHACLCGKYLFESFGIAADADLASEFPYRQNVLDKNALVCVITQSGETADTLEAVRIAKRNGNKIFAIVNVVGSTVSREANWVLYTHCGPEIAVASTKAFTSQLAALYVLLLHIAYKRDKLLITKAREYAKELIEIPKVIRKIFKSEEYIKKIVDDVSDKNDFLYTARGINYPIALEGALKLKEISYLHAEGYAAGEMKHGPIAIINEGMPVVAISLSTSDLELMRSNIEEVKARGAKVIALCDDVSSKYVRADWKIIVPKVSEWFSPVTSVIPLQIFAYYVAFKKGLDIDKPRNLAKSVTVK
ncbi:MAG: glutamine--fructose-6-phosphate transaminase (isomerizing) [Elusimicrobiales bacterium]|nr:glutamine--fructose-6-phosphate transaminase (isomerizing) [Elusimicrobiales bacterium]